MTLPTRNEKESLGAYYVRLKRSLDLSYTLIAAQLNADPIKVHATATRYLHRKNQELKPKKLELNEIVLSPSIGDLPPVMHIDTENIALLADLHAPLHNVTMLKRFIYVVRNYFPHITDLGLVGDVFNFDTFKDHPNIYESLLGSTEVQLAGSAVYDVISFFKRCFCVWGNHETRLKRKTNSQLHLEQLYGLAFAHKRGFPNNCSMEFTERSYATIGQKWLILHPAKYSKQAGKVPSEASNYFERNVISYHNHITGETQSTNGKYVGIDGGHMTDPNKHGYVLNEWRGLTEWNSGFVIISNGYAYRFTEKFTDWKYYGL